MISVKKVSLNLCPEHVACTLIVDYLFGRVFNDLIDDFTKSDLKYFWDDFKIFKITLKYGDLNFNLIQNCP
jgi:hypothetical protein